MKAMVCEMCNSRDMVKQEGYVICQSCGTKYTVEEAKKMMVEVEGAVKIDNSDTVQNFLQNARRAKQKQDWEEVEKYYNMVEANDPTNIEAIFYSAYGKARVSLTDGDLFKRQAVFKALINSISILVVNYDIQKEAELRDVLKNIVQDVMALYGCEFVYTQTKNGYGAITGSNKGETYRLFDMAFDEMFNTLEKITEKHPENQFQDVASLYRLLLLMGDWRLDLTLKSIQAQKYSQREIPGVRYHVERCVRTAAKLRAVDPSYTPVNYTARWDEVTASANNFDRNMKIFVGLFVAAVIILCIIVFTS